MLDALRARFQLVPAEICKSLIWDRGNEMVLDEHFSESTGIDVYFCDPHSPWQRPSNENTNGLIRQYFPKRSDLRIHDQTVLDQAATELNQRPRLVLDDGTPEEVPEDFLRNVQTLTFATTG